MSVVEASKVPGQIETELVDARVLVTCVRGFVTAAVAESRFGQFVACAAHTMGALWIVDSLGITGFQPATVQAGARWYDVFKKRGGTRLVLVSDMSAVRMAAATLAIAAHIKVTNCRTMGEAYQHAGLEPQAITPSMYSFSPPRTGSR